jgi:hypothetical protein
VGFIGMIKREYLAGQKSHVPIPYQGLFQAVSYSENFDKV